MHRIITLFVVLFLSAGLALAQTMSDDQVVQFVKDGQQQGKTQKQMTTELMRQGVTQQQVERIQRQYQASSAGTDSNSTLAEPSRLRRSEEPPTYAPHTPVQRPTTSERQDIFGHNIFTNPNLTFEPNSNMATPANYRLGPGDEVIIDVWGASENTIRQTITPEGNIQISSIGPIHLSGLTIQAATDYLQREFTQIYAGISGNAPTSQVKVSLGDTRTIQVNIMGEVAVPGTYSLSSFSSVFHALYRAGGVNPIGSLRSIKVVRSGKTVADLDVYSFIMKGQMNDDVRLQEGDVILVEPYDRLVKISGKVKRPMRYEMKQTEPLSTLLRYAGGFTGDAYQSSIRVIRKSDREHQVYNVDEMDYSVFRLTDGDELQVESVLSRFENRVEVRGAVMRPGLYQINGTVNTVKQLIAKAEGIRGDAFLNRVIIDRENEDLSHQIIAVDLKGLLAGTSADIPLMRNDVLYIPSDIELKEQATLTIHGEVANPGTFTYAQNITVEDLIIQAGGLLESASTIRVDIARRLKNPKETGVSNVIGETFSIDLKDGLTVSGSAIALEPFDEVYVRRSPAYFKQINVRVTGEVLFAGSFALTQKNERLSDLIAKAGGITPDAYVKGARLVRKMGEEEYRRKADALRLASKSGKDSIAVDKLELDDTYSVGIDLQRALANPRSSYDMVLRQGDQLFVPEYISTVKINGSVMYPNTVLYQEGQDMRYYINQAGGYEKRARKKSAYVVYMNGTVSRLTKRNQDLIQPGCEIIVPSKGEKQRMTSAEVLSLGTSSASLATMVATMVNLFK